MLSDPSTKHFYLHSICTKHLPTRKLKHECMNDNSPGNRSHCSEEKITEIIQKFNSSKQI